MPTHDRIGAQEAAKAMDHNDAIRLFESQHIRTAWDEEKEEWYFSIVDMIGILTNQPDLCHVAKYWSVLKPA